MKRYIVILLAMFGICFSSCSLQEDPNYFVDDTQYYQNFSQCRIAVNSVYKRLNALYDFKMFTLTEAHSDVFYEPAPTVTEARLELSPAQPGFGEDIWKYCYEMVMYSNGVLARVAEAPISDEQKLFLLSETAIMRAFYYYLLTSLFNDVPFYTMEIATVRDMAIVEKLGRMSAVDTRTYLINELNDYIAQMQASDKAGVNPGGTNYMIKSSEVPENRVGASVALMLVAKMAMWNAAKDSVQAPEYWYNVAVSALETLEGIYGKLSQYSLEDIMFRHKNTPESIFEIQHTYTSGGLEYVKNLAAIMSPYRSESNGKIYWDGLELDIYNEYTTSWTPARLNLIFCREIQPVKGTDVRAALNMAIEYNGKQFNAIKNSVAPYPGPKFWCPNMYMAKDFNNYTIFRYADAVLMLSECHYHLGERDKSISYLNQVRTRAGLEACEYKTDKRLFRDIQDERARELCGEFQRKFDLVRWGVWYQWTKGYNDYAKLVENIRPCHEYLPIPDKQVKASNGHLDNKEYNKYGM